MTLVDYCGNTIKPGDRLEQIHYRSQHECLSVSLDGTEARFKAHNGAVGHVNQRIIDHMELEVVFSPR